MKNTLKETPVNQKNPFESMIWVDYTVPRTDDGIVADISRQREESFLR